MAHVKVCLQILSMLNRQSMFIWKYDSTVANDKCQSICNELSILNSLSMWTWKYGCREYYMSNMCVSSTIQVYLKSRSIICWPKSMFTLRHVLWKVC